LGIVTSGGYSGALDTPENKEFIKAFREKYNRAATPYAEKGYTGAMILEKALISIRGNVEDREALLKAFQDVEIPNAPRGPVKLDKYHNVVHNIYIREVKKIDGKLVNAVIETYGNVSQFWKWTPENYMKGVPYSDMKGKWTK